MKTSVLYKTNITHWWTYIVQTYSVCSKTSKINF